MKKDEDKKRKQEELRIKALNEDKYYVDPLSKSNIRQQTNKYIDDQIQRKEKYLNRKTDLNIKTQCRKQGYDYITGRELTQDSIHNKKKNQIDIQ